MKPVGDPRLLDSLHAAGCAALGALPAYAGRYPRYRAMSYLSLFASRPCTLVLLGGWLEVWGRYGGYGVTSRLRVAALPDVVIEGRRSRHLSLAAPDLGRLWLDVRWAPALDGWLDR